MQKTRRIFVNITRSERKALDWLVQCFGSHRRLFDIVALRCELLSMDENNQIIRQELETKQHPPDAVDTIWTVYEDRWGKITEAAYRLNIDRNRLVGFVLIGIEKQKRELRQREIEQATEGQSLLDYFNAYCLIGESMLERAYTDWSWINRGLLYYKHSDESAKFQRYGPFLSPD